MYFFFYFQHLDKGIDNQNQLLSSFTALSKSKEKYEKAQGSQQWVKGLHTKWVEDTKKEYNSQKQKSSEHQEKFYNKQLPSIFHNLQNVEEKRIKIMKISIIKSMNVEKGVLEKLSQCLDGMSVCSEYIDEKEDSRIVIEKFKSGFQSTNPAEILDATIRPRSTSRDSIAVHDKWKDTISRKSKNVMGLLGKKVRIHTS